MIKPNSSFTVFTIESLDRAKAYYSRNFGFSVAFENEWYLHLVSESGIQVGFLLPNQPTQPNIFHKSYDGNGVIFSFEVENVESAYSEAKANSLDIVLDLRSEDWGQHHFCIKDPNGIYLDIVQAIEPTEEYQQGYGAE
ncbi:MAG: VOC family protein [Gammaproteobacteria bacterium]|nr:VOC family protein [Gammaproteobacteria bacterium]MBL4898735.1 VOC family protein [Colwellia sp.]